MHEDDPLPTLITGKAESNFDFSYSLAEGKKERKKKNPHHEDTAFEMLCNSHDMLHPPRSIWGKTNTLANL